jgi:hypothetical protein
VPQLEAFSKRAAITALLAITTLQLALHPDTTWPLRVIGLAAFAIGWFSSAAAGRAIHLSWLLLAPLAPALVLEISGRQGPIVDVLWMAGLTGSVLRAIPWSTWSFPATWKPLLGGWALVLSLSWPVFVAREADFDLQALRDISAVNSWAMLTAIQVVAWTLYSTQVQLLGLLWFDWICRAFEDSVSPLPGIVNGLWIGVTVASCVAIVQGTVDITFLNTQFWIDRLRAPGTMLDANAYGFAAAVAGPIGFLALRGRSWRSDLLAGMVLVVNWSGLWMSGSRTTLLCALFGAAGLTIGALRARSDRRVIVVATAIAVAAAIVTSAATISPVQRAMGLLAGRANVETLWNREGYGTVATQMVREYPLAGVGAGGYRYLAPDYWRVIDDSQLPLDNAQNWWRHQLAELGVLGGALILLWSLLVAAQTLAGRARAEHALTAWTIRALVAGIGVVSLVGMPTQNPVALLAFFLLVVWMNGVVKRWPPPAPAQWVRAAWAVAAVSAVGYVAVHVVLATGPLSVSARAIRFHREYVQGAYAPEPAPGGGHFQWTDEEARLLLPARTPWLVMRLWAHHPDIAEHPVEVTLSAPCGAIFTRQLESAAPIAVGILLPPGSDTLDATITVSRTWRPAQAGDADPRRLGVAVGAEFVDDRQLVFSQDYLVEWTCPAD